MTATGRRKVFTGACVEPRRYDVQLDKRAGMRASRMTYVAGNAVVQACDDLRSLLARQAARALECRPEVIEFDAHAVDEGEVKTAEFAVVVAFVGVIEDAAGFEGSAEASSEEDRHFG